jgi:hypothetical protein
MSYFIGSKEEPLFRERFSRAGFEIPLQATRRFFVDDSNVGAQHHRTPAAGGNHMPILVRFEPKFQIVRRSHINVFIVQMRGEELGSEEIWLIRYRSGTALTGRSPKLAAFVALACPLDMLARLCRATPHPANRSCAKQSSSPHAPSGASGDTLRCCAAQGGAP